MFLLFILTNASNEGKCANFSKTRHLGYDPGATRLRCGHNAGFARLFSAGVNTWSDRLIVSWILPASAALYLSDIPSLSGKVTQAEAVEEPSIYSFQEPGHGSVEILANGELLDPVDLDRFGLIDVRQRLIRDRVDLLAEDPAALL